MRFVMFLLAFSATLDAADMVLVRNPSSSRGVTRLVGTVTEYTSQGVRLQDDDGEETLVSPEKVLEIRYSRPPVLEEADHCYQNGDYAQTLTRYLQEAQMESVPWKKMLLLERVMDCNLRMGKLRPAILAFLEITALVPDMPDTVLASAPMAWKPQMDFLGMEESLVACMKSKTSAEGTLLAASYLLSGARRDEAITCLENLSRGKNQRVAMLAQAQLWRTELVSVTEDDLARWKEAIEQLPEPLRGGPYFVLGQGYARLGNTDEASLAFLKTVLLFHRNFLLAQQAEEANDGLREKTE